MQECRENKVMEYEVFTSPSGTGLAVMSGLYRFFVVNNVNEPKVSINKRCRELKNLRLSLRTNFNL